MTQARAPQAQVPSTGQPAAPNAPAPTPAPSGADWATERTADRTAELTERLTALSALITTADGRLDVPAIDAGRKLLSRADERLQLSTSHAVAALVGATGSGKSSMFNAISGLDISPSSVRRPTTSRPHACVWGDDPAEELLDWLGVADRNKVRRSSMLPGADSSELDGFVLLDLPDHDSTNVTHRLEVDRMVELADLLVWVLDPQKYADAAIHQRYLRHLAEHQRSTLVLLNQIDLLSEEDAVACINDVKRLLADDGLRDVPVLGVSAKTGAGLEVLKARFVSAVVSRAAAVDRLAGDLDSVSDGLVDVAGIELAPEVAANGGDPQAVNGLADDLAKAAGVPTVADTVEGAYALRARQMTGWTWARMVRGMLPERESRLPKSVRNAPLAQRAARGGGVHARMDDERSAVGRAAVDGGLRAYADRTAAWVAPAWRDRIEKASRSRADEIPVALDGVLAGTDLGLSRRPTWWRTMWLVQWLLVVVALIGGVWQVMQALVPYVPALAFVHQVQEVLPGPELVRLLIGAIVLAVCLALGVVLALVTRPMVTSGAARAGRRADQRLREGVWTVVRERVLAPVRQELSAYLEMRKSYVAMHGRRR